MTEKPPENSKKSTICLEILVPVLAFGSTLVGMALHDAGLLSEIQYAAAGGFFSSCILAYLAWTRLHKDIVALSTPIYGFIFVVTPIDYTGGVALQLLYAVGLTILAARLRYRFGAGIAGGSSTKDLSPGPLLTYVESTRSTFAALSPAAGRSAADAFFSFSEGEYGKAANAAHAASCQDGIPAPMVRAYGILRQHAELLDKDLPCPVTFQKFLPEDADVIAKPLPGSKDPERESGIQLDNALLLLYSAAWYASPENRPSLLGLQHFAGRLIAG